MIMIGSMTGRTAAAFNPSVFATTAAVPCAGPLPPKNGNCISPALAAGTIIRMLLLMRIRTTNIIRIIIIKGIRRHIKDTIRPTRLESLPCRTVQARKRPARLLASRNNDGPWPKSLHKSPTTPETKKRPIRVFPRTINTRSSSHRSAIDARPFNINNNKVSRRRPSCWERPQLLSCVAVAVEPPRYAPVSPTPTMVIRRILSP